MVFTPKCRDRHLEQQKLEQQAQLNPGLALDELDFEGDGYVFADEDATCFESRVPDQPEVPAIDLRGSGKANAVVAPRVLRWLAHIFDAERDRLGDAVQGEVARDFVVGAPG